MAKRHHSSMRGGEMYASHKGSMALKKHDSGMIHEDPSAACLLPTHVIEKQFEQGHYSAPAGIVDLYSGVQRRIKQDSSDLRRETEVGNFW